MYDAIVVGELDKLALLDTEAHGEELVLDVTQCEPLPLPLIDALPQIEEVALAQVVVVPLRESCEVGEREDETQGVDVPQPEADELRVPLPELLGQADTETDEHKEAVAEELGHNDGVALRLALPDGQRDTVAVAQELVEPEGLDDAELQ